MSRTKRTSKKFSWNQLDFLKAAIHFGLATALTTILTSVDAGHFPGEDQWIMALKIGGLAAFSYLIKQFLTPEYVMIKTEPTKEEEAKENPTL